DSQAARAGVLVVPAMGVGQQYYSAFSQWLAARGYFVVTFDYRGIGHSRHGPLRGFRADVVMWAERDTAAVLAFVRERIEEKPLLWIGHSLGGQILGLVPGRERVRAMVTVTAGSGHWRDYVPKLRRLAPVLWYVIVPLALLAGYFPGRALGIVGDVPAGVMRQWRSWCLDPDYLFGVLPPDVRTRYAASKLPILSLSFTDDEFLSRRNIESLHSFYAGANVEMQRLSPQDVGVPGIGHFGFFRKCYESSLWPRVADFLDRHAGLHH
ncbi:MAG: alpha/beta hydrolase family protein, partial [Burkholderiaceae bacterium]